MTTHKCLFKFVEVSRYEGIGEPTEITYTVTYNGGRILGKVSPCWHRYGGHGWGWSLNGYSSGTCGTRRHAAQSLKCEMIRRQKILMLVESFSYRTEMRRIF